MDDIISRITNYLANGGLFNPEYMEHEKVRRLLMDCRDEVIAASTLTGMMLEGTGQRAAESVAERVINGQTVGVWIPVSERLPEKNEPVCVVCGGKVTVGTYSPMMDDWWALVLPVTGIQPTDSVTHWLPLPGSPT